MMPASRAATAVVNGKKTLSDSEVLAYSKNRFVEHSLRQKVRQLSDEEQECHDRHQREIFRWRDFMRQSTRTTGVWSTSLHPDTDPWSENEDDQEPTSAEEGVEDPTSPTQRGSPKGNPSTELARSLTFQSEALSQLQKPWAYTYSEASHNTMYKDALQVARVKEKRLLFRRVASAANPLSQRLSSKSPLRTKSSAGEWRRQKSARSTRPHTGRSTPGVLRKSGSRSRDRLTASASVDKNRPKTSASANKNRPKTSGSANKNRPKTSASAKKNRPKTSVGVVRASQKQNAAWTTRDKQGEKSSSGGVRTTGKVNKAGLDSPRTTLTQNWGSDTTQNGDESGSDIVKNSVEEDKAGLDPSQTSRTQSPVSDSLDTEQNEHHTGDNGRNARNNYRNSSNGRNFGNNGHSVGENDHYNGGKSLSSGDKSPVTEDSENTTVIRLGDSGEPVKTLSAKEESAVEDKLPIIHRRKHGMVSNIRLTLHGNRVVEDTDNVDSRLNEELTQQANPQTNNQQESEQEIYSESSGDAASATDPINTPEVFDDNDNSSKRQGKGSNKRLHIRFAARKEKVDSNSSETKTDPDTEAVTSQSLTPARDGTQTESDADINEDQDVFPLAPSATQGAPPSPLNQSESSSENKEDKRLIKAVTSAFINNRPSEVRARQRVALASEQLVTGISSVPTARTAPRRRGSFMNIVDQLQALKVGNRRRSTRPDDDTDAETADKEVSRTPHDSTSSMTNDKPTAVTDTKDGTHHKYAKPANSVVAVAIPKNSPETKPENKLIFPKLDKIKAAPRTSSKSVFNDLQSLSTDKQTLQVGTTEIQTLQGGAAEKQKLPGGAEKAVVIEPHLELPPHPDPHYEDEDFYRSDERSLADSDCTTFRGYKIRNYVRPQCRYRSDPFLTNRRERSLVRLSIEYPVYLNGNRGDLKSDMLFPKTCRQKVLQELVQRNHQPLPVPDSGVVPPELKAKIDEFFKTLEPYCPKPEIVFE